MLALVLNGSEVRLVSARKRPQPAQGFVRVRTRAAGVCNTDLELARGYMGFSGVLGHEFVGEALEGALAGRRVVGGINFGCGSCAACNAGMSRHCSQRTVLGILGADGVFAEEFVIPEANLIEVPDGLEDAAAVFTEPLAAACEIVEQLGHCARGAALVLGDGKLGPLIAQVLALEGFTVDLVGRHLDSLGWLAERGVKLAGSAPARKDYGLAVDATGSAAGLQTAIASVAPRGVVVLKSTVEARHEIDLAPLVINEISLVGSRCGRMQPALSLLAAGKVSVAALIDARFPLERADEGFVHAARSGVRKVLLENL